jgi:ketosteroid isomerase-like protein
MDDVYAINVAKSHYRDGFNSGNVDQVLSAFAPEFTDMSDGRPSGYGADASSKLRQRLSEIFQNFDAQLKVIIIAINVSGNVAFDYGWHELTLVPKSGGDSIHRRTRYLEIWARQANGEWRISKFMDNGDLPDTVVVS